MNKLLILLAIFLLANSTSAATTGFDHYLKQAQTYEAFLNDLNPDAAVKAYLQDTLLRAYDEEENYNQDFERELDLLVVIAQRDPKFHADPSQSATYQNILRLDAVIDSLSEELAYVYKRLIDSSDPASVRVLHAIDKYFAELSESDHVTLEPVLERLEQVRANQSHSEILPLVEPITLRVHMQTKRASSHGHNHGHSPRLERELLEDVVKHPTPPLSLIEPGLGAGGNVTGDEFPDGIFALTFDDGPDPQYTEPLMEALLAHQDKVNPNGAPASFFWQAKNVAFFKETVALAASRGFSLNCHSWDHADLTHASFAKRTKEVIDATELEEQAFGRKIGFYRCPSGACGHDQVVRGMIKDLNMVHAYWNIDSRDWKHKNADRTFNWVTKQIQIQKRGIVLMHDVHPYSLEAAVRLLAWIKEQNDTEQQRIELHTIDDAVKIHNAQLPSPTPLPNND